MGLSFDSLPEGVLRSVLGFVDIASLGALCNTHKAAHENIASLASDDVTWYALIQNRFGIGCDRRSGRRQKRCGVVLVNRGSSSSLSSAGKRSSQRGRRRSPTTYGGVTWKDAYRSLSSTMRMPETRITSGSHTSSGGAVFASPHLRGRTVKNSLADFFGVWCMVNHSENCCTKIVQGLRGRRLYRSRCNVDRETNALPYPVDRRYIELKLCLQNTKSGFGSVVVPDVTALCVASLDEEDYFSSWGWDKWDDEYDATFKLIKAGPWAPKILLRRRFGDENADHERGDLDTKEWNAQCDEKDITLRPFEVIVISVHISCPGSLVYETDVLSSMSSIRVPIIADGWPSNKQLYPEGLINNKDVSIARFIPEDNLWEYYSQLPGGCLSLTDRSRLVPM